MLTLEINGRSLQIDADPDMPLLWAIRDHADLTGTKFGCGQALCGACTVHVDGQATRSCSLAAGDAQGRKITTIEGIEGKVAEAVQAAWRKLDVVQCGYCQSGQIMSAVALLTENKAPSETDIELAMDGNICRCGTYLRIKAAIQDAARALA
ncbi:MAG: (2Fe-2S)-binding protein [Phreatobacter sp.]